jgi:hypothetical protein
MNAPSDVWSDGNRIIVADQLNNRVLIWNSWPTADGQVADLVLGQNNFTDNTANQGGGLVPTASTLYEPYTGLFVNGDQLFIGDARNCRVMIWNSWPTRNGQAADVVLGEPDFGTASCGTSDTLMNDPSGIYLSGTSLIVADYYARYLVFEGSY